jgi:hypothetical protein
MPTPPTLAVSSRHLSDASAGLRLLEAFYAFGVLHIGVQRTAWEEDERCWDSDEQGRWRGPAPLRTVVANLRLTGVAFTGAGADQIAMASAGGGLEASWEYAYLETGISAGEVAYILQNAASGATVETGLVPARVTTPGSLLLPELPGGSYLLWMRLEGVQTGLRLPSDYSAVTGYNTSTLPARFRYTEGEEEKYWDWEYNVGQLPSDAAHPFYESRRDVLEANAQKDRPEWAEYIVDDTPRGGEWSVLKIHVGAGSWSAGAITPAPGMALATAQNNIETAVRFDPVARCVSAWTQLVDGTHLIAGTRASRSGIDTALWELHADGTSTLLGLNVDLSTGWCECAKANHSATDILEKHDGSVFVLSHCALFAYRPEAPSARERLVGVPQSSGGHPGGQCLREEAGTLYWMTEAFSQTGQDQFYNTQKSLTGAASGSGKGTVFHGANAMEKFLGKRWGIRQRGAFDDPATLQTIAFFDGLEWSDYSWLTRPASAYRLQRLRAVAGRLIVFGYHPTLKTGLAVLCDPQNNSVQDVLLPYRVRRVTRTHNSAGAPVLLAIAYADADDKTLPPRRLIELSGYTEDEDGGDPDVPDNAGDAHDDLLVKHPNTKWRAFRLHAFEEPIAAYQVTDRMEGQPLEALVKGEFPYLLWGRTDSSAPYNDLTTYNQLLHFSGLLVPPSEARLHQDVVILLPSGQGLTAIELPAAARRA